MLSRSPIARVAITFALLATTGCVLPFLSPAEEEPEGRRDRGGEGEGEEGEGEGEGEGESPPPPPTCAGAGCPQILSLSSNVTSVDPETDLVVSAIVTDPDGIDDLIGGTLFDPTSSGTYGTFQTSAAEGAYELRLTWEDLNTVRAIDFEGSGSRVLRARFFDQVGNETFGDVSVTLGCFGRDACDGGCGLVRCGNECVTDTLVDDDHCGRCNQACPGELTCTDREPLSGDSIPPSCLCNGESGTGIDQCTSSCVDLSEDVDNCGGCGDVCGGGFCEMGACSCSTEGAACSGPHGVGDCVRARTGGSSAADLCFATGRGRLTGGANADQGFLEVEVNGVFRQACTDDFSPDQHLANAWCTQLRSKTGRLELRARELDTFGVSFACESANVASCDIADIEAFAGCPGFDEPAFLVCDDSGEPGEGEGEGEGEGDFSCSEGTLTVNASGSTTSEDDTMATTCNRGGADRVFTFTAPQAGTYLFSTANSEFDTVLEVFTDCGTESLGCNDDFGGARTSAVRGTLLANQQVLIVVDGFDGVTGSFQLTVALE